MKLVFDIETDGLLDDLTKIHTIVIKWLETGEVIKYRPVGDELQEAVDNLKNADLIIGHNIIAFDIPAIQKIFPDFNPVGIFDTLVASRLIWSDIKNQDFRFSHHTDFPNKLIGKHSLKAWGYRLGLLKGEFAEETDWQEWSEDMTTYCANDVSITDKLYQRILDKKYSDKSLELEHQFAQCIWEQEKHGFYFDVKKAQKLNSKLAQRRLELEGDLQKVFTEWEKELPDFIPKRDNKTKGYKAGVPVKKTKTITFNPGSRDHIANRLITLKGWKPRKFTPDGKPVVDEAVLNSLKYPEAKLLSEYLMITKRLGQLAEGSVAWLKLEKNGKIHGSVNSNGAITGRCLHMSPNISQCPSVLVPYGRECRELFYAPDGYKLVGVDVSGLELRCLAHYLTRYDEGEYANEVVNGDVHTLNQKSAGLDTRDRAKTFIYAFLYGAGDRRIADITGSTVKEAKALKEKFLDNAPAIRRLRHDVLTAVETRGFLRGIDGRRLEIRSPHSALNTLIQSAGALIVKQATIALHKIIQQEKLDCSMVAHIHDEMQLQVKEDITEYVGQQAVQSIQATKDFFDFRCELDGEFKIGKTWADTH